MSAFFTAANYFAVKISYTQLSFAAALLNVAAPLVSTENDPSNLFSL